MRSGGTPFGARFCNFSRGRDFPEAFPSHLLLATRQTELRRFYERKSSIPEGRVVTPGIHTHKLSPESLCNKGSGTPQPRLTPCGVKTLGNPPAPSHRVDVTRGKKGKPEKLIMSLVHSTVSGEKALASFRTLKPSSFHCRFAKNRTCSQGRQPKSGPYAYARFMSLSN